METNLTEQTLWALLNHLSWWYWGPVCLLAGVVLWEMYGMVMPGSIWTRVCFYAGLMLVLGGLGNTALPSLGLPLVLLGLRGWVRYAKREDRRAGRYTVPSGPISVKVASVLVTPHR